MSDEKILKSAYKINLFRVPRNLPSKVPIIKRDRPEYTFQLFLTIVLEIVEITSENRPVLVIFNTIKQVEDFLKATDKFLNHNKLSTIKGIIPENERKSIEIAGQNGHITKKTTAAAGRGMNIKLDEISLKNDYITCNNPIFNGKRNSF